MYEHTRKIYTLQRKCQHKHKYSIKNVVPNVLNEKQEETSYKLLKIASSQFANEKNPLALFPLLAN